MLSRIGTLKIYGPVLGMVLAVVLQALWQALSDNRLSVEEILTLVLGLSGAVATYVVPRFPSLEWLKPLTAAVTAGLVFLVSALEAGVSRQEWVMVGIQVLVGLGIVTLTNGSVPLTPTAAEPAPPGPLNPA